MTIEEDRPKPGPKGPHAPEGLNERARKVWKSVTQEYDLEEWQLDLLRRGCETITQIDEARESLAKGLYIPGSDEAVAAPGSLVYFDRFGQPQRRPEVSIIRQGINQQLQIFQKLYLDPPEESDYV